MPHAFITIAIPFNAEFVGETAETVKRIGNPSGQRSAKLAKSGIVHFASLTIVPPSPQGKAPIWLLRCLPTVMRTKRLARSLTRSATISQMFSMPPASTGPPRTLRRSSPTRATG